MPNTVPSPNMGMPVPVVGVDPGPDWAANVVASLSIIDSHSHTPGQGVLITPGGLNMNVDLPFGGNNGINLRSSRYTAQSGPLNGASDLGCVYVSGLDLYYNDIAGNQVRITQSGSVSGSAGTITGLPSGTASASYSAGTFTFQGATNTPATMAVGPIKIGEATASPHMITVASPSGLAANYNFTLPASVGLANQALITDGSGNQSWSYGLMPLGSVTATFPSLAGAYVCSATTTADTRGFVLCGGQTIADASSPMNGATIPNINNSVFLMGSATDNTSGGGNTTTLTNTQLPAHGHSGGTLATSIGISNNTVGSSAHVHNMAHVHQWGFASGVTAYFYVLTSLNQGTVSITNSNIQFLDKSNQNFSSGNSNSPIMHSPSSSLDLYTTGALGTLGGSGNSATTDPPSATTTVTLTGSNTVGSGVSSTTGSGAAYDSRPNYISAVYIMRVK